MNNYEKQLHLPFDTYIEVGWWKTPPLWKKRHSVSVISRPCEDAALDNIYYASKTIDISRIAELSGLERRIFELELRSMLPNTLPRWYTAPDRQQWIAKQARMDLSTVKGILDNVSYRLWTIA